MSFQSVEKHDIVIGVVSSVMDSGLVITLLCLDNGKSRDIDQLRISVSQQLISIYIDIIALALAVAVIDFYIFLILLEN